MWRPLLVLVCLSGGSCFAQQASFELMLQGEGDNVKLLWLPNEWPQGVTGFNVKRRSTGGEWKRLNTDPIHPTVHESDLLTRSNDSVTINDLFNTRGEMLAKNSIAEVSLQQRLGGFKDDPVAVKFLRFQAAQSYQGALVLGLAYYDARVPEAQSYDYGLFTLTGDQESAGPAATRTWKPGTRPELSLTFGAPEVSGYEGTEGLNIFWSVTTSEVRSKNVREFRVMKRDAQGIVTEVGRKQVNHAEATAPVGLFDPEYPHHEAATFYLEPVDIFDFVGRPSMEVTYDNQKYPGRAQRKASAPPAPSVPRAFEPPSGIVTHTLPDRLLPPPDDAAEIALSNYPVMPGNSSPEAKNCAFSGQPGDAKYCLRPADRMQFWLRADDFGPRYTIVKLWQAPKLLRNWAQAGPQVGEYGWRMSDQIGALPAMRLADRSSFAIKVPFQAAEFTLFIVGRQIPGTARGVILSSGNIDTRTIEWRHGKALVFAGGPEPTEFEYTGVNEYHIVAVRYIAGRASVHANNEAVYLMPVDLGSEPIFRFVGTTPGGAVSAMNALTGGWSTKPPENPASGADIAEIILWPHAITDEEMRGTARYLRKKYALP